MTSPAEPFFCLLYMGTSKLPESNGAGRSHIEGIHPVGHGDAHCIVAVRNSVCRQAVPLGTQDDRQLVRCHKPGVIDAYGLPAQRHGGSLKAQRP